LPGKTKGVYLFRFRLPRKETVQVGRLGFLEVPAGYYIYTGSAMGGLQGRLKRHLNGPPKSGSLHWHIDYISAKAVDKSFAVIVTGSRAECDLNLAVAAIPGAEIAAPGFGCSDCRCSSHLYRLAQPVWPDYPGLEIRLPA